MLPQSPYTSLSNAPPALTLHNDNIFTMSERGQVAIFNPRFGKWTERNDMNMKMQENYDGILASYNSKLYAIEALMTGKGIDMMASQGRSMMGLAGPIQPIVSKGCTIYVHGSNSKWKKISEFGQGPLQSAAIVDGTAFVHTGEKVYKVLLEKKRVNAFTSEPQLGAGQGWLAQTTSTLPQFGGEAFGGEALLSTALLSTAQGRSPTSTATEIASLPYLGSTLYTIKDTLFSFRGRDENHQPTSDVLRYNLDTDTWESAGYMRSCRYNVAVTTMQDTTLDVFVVGGSFGSSRHIMKPRAYTLDNAPQKQNCWDNNTSILEKCTVN